MRAEALPVRRLGLALLLLLALPVAWYLGSPLFINQRVSEAPPLQSAANVSLRGMFGEIDAIHKGQGTVTIVESADGAAVMRFEDFQVTNGPDLYVYLSGHPAPRTSAELHQVDAYEVATLKGNVGAQNYTLPADLDLSRFKSVVIYCKRFTTVFSTAAL
jgi:hypothetical protein